MATFKNDYAFGIKSEKDLHEKLENHFETKLVRRGGYASFDFDNTTNLYLELKTRRICHNNYPTALVSASKIKVASENPQNTYWICYGFVDGIYGIKYDKELFDTFEIGDYTRGNRTDFKNVVQTICFIPTEHLIRLF